MKSERTPLVTAIIGKRRVGKTTYLRKVIETYRATQPLKKILVVDTFESPDYLDIPRIDLSLLKRWKEPSIYKLYGNDTDDIIFSIEKYLYNTLLIFEDATKYILSNPQKEIRKIIIDSKQKGNDVLFVFHGFSSVPPSLFKLLDRIVLFKSDNPSARKHDMTAADEIISAWTRIMKSKNLHVCETIKIY